jgi:hypothetical protein
MHNMKRIRKHRRRVIAVSVYLALWLTTYLIACPQARRHMLVESGITADVAEVPVGDEFFMFNGDVPSTRYAFNAVAYAPFLVTVRFGVLRQGWGYGGTYIYLWWGRLGPRMKVWGWVT